MAKGATDSSRMIGWHESPNNPDNYQWWNGKSWSEAWWPMPIEANGGTYQPDWKRVHISNGKLGPRLDIVGENWHEAAIQNAIGQQLPLGEAVTVQRVVELVPEPDNPFDGHAISVRYDDEVIGYIAAEQTFDYLQLVESVIQSEQVPTVTADIWAVRRKTRGGNIGVFSNVRIDLDSSIQMPANEPPSRPYSIIPQGRKVQVSGEEKHFDVLSEYVGPEPLEVLVTLEIETVTTAKTQKEIIAVYLDDRPVGVLSPATSTGLIPTIRYLNEESGLVATAWATVTGSRLAAELTLSITKSENIGDEFLDGDPNVLKIFNKKTTHIPNAYREVIDSGKPPARRSIHPLAGIMLYFAIFIFIWTPATVVFSVAGIAYLIYFYTFRSKQPPGGSHLDPTVRARSNG